MRHRKSFNHLGRKSPHRKAMLANMATSLILHKRIKTTTAKAKALKMYVEPLITKSKEDSTHSRRVVFSYLKDKYAVSELFREISTKVGDRPGGYTRILKTGTRLGDNADMCIIELVDYNENLLAAKEDSTKKTTKRRRRRGGSGAAKQEEKQVQAPQATEKVAEETSVTEVVEEQKAEATEAVTETVEEAKEEQPVEAKQDEAPEETKEEGKTDDSTEDKKDS